MAIPPPEAPRRAHQPETWALRALGAAEASASGALARRMGLHPTDLSAMSHVAAAEGRLGPRELSTRLGLTPAAVTDVVDRLQAAGHLLRERDTTDRRRVRLVPSESAATEVRGQLRSLLDRLDALTGEFTDAERDAIRRYLEAATEAYRDFAEEP